MSKKDFQKALVDLHLGELRYYDTIGSSNDEALAWASQGAPDLSVVFADEQTIGRGRMGRKWYTPPDSALAFSLILHPALEESTNFSLFSGLGALALTEVLNSRGVNAQIKWPNDVLISGKKVAGILVEAVWLGDQVESVILGMGVNVMRSSVPPIGKVLFPATSLEDHMAPLHRFDLLHDILSALIAWRSRMDGAAFLAMWEQRLAFKGEQVKVWSDQTNVLSGIVRGLDTDGSLKLETSSGILQSIRYGEVHLRPMRL